MCSFHSVKWKKWKTQKFCRNMHMSWRIRCIKIYSIMFWECSCWYFPTQIATRAQPTHAKANGSRRTEHTETCGIHRETYKWQQVEQNSTVSRSLCGWASERTNIKNTRVCRFLCVRAISSHSSSTAYRKSNIMKKRRRQKRKRMSDERNKIIINVYYRFHHIFAASSLSNATE